VNARDSAGHTPMAVASLLNNIAATKLLIDFGGDRTIRSNSDASSNPNSTPLDIAKQSNHEEIVKLLTEYSPSEE
jgi:ankyrin repeat protein